MEFTRYGIVPLKNLGEHCEQCDDRHAEFWGLFGFDNQDNAYAIGDFNNKSDAEFIKAAIEGG